MDWNEIKKGFKNRHPWELSRTKKVASLLEKKIGIKLGERHKFLDIGAGDMFFDQYWIKKHKMSKCYAIDIGYSPEVLVKNNEKSHIKKFNTIDQIPAEEFDFALMLDSLEYFEDEVAYIDKLKSYIKSDGYILFLVPAFSKLYSDHDRHAKLLKRYDMVDLENIISRVEGVEMCYNQYFYFSLLIVRTIQVLFKLKIDPDEKLTTNWPYSEKEIATRLVVSILNIDFAIQTFLRKIGIKWPGLSILMLCKKVD